MEITKYINVEVSAGKSKAGADEVKANLKSIRKDQDDTKQSSKRLGDEFDSTAKKAKRASKEAADSVSQVGISIKGTINTAQNAKSAYAQPFVQLKKSADESATSVKKTGDAIQETGQKTERATKRSKDGFEGVRRKIQETRKSTEDFGNKTQEATDKVERGFNKATSSVKSYVAGFVSVTAVVATLASLITLNAEFESGVLGVAKTTGLAGKELEMFSRRIDEISTNVPVSTAELLELAQSAGAMGVTGAANLEKFSVTVAKLGRASNLAGEEAASSLARILTVSGEATDYVDTLASVIVALGNSTAATEKEIAEITNTVAQATSVFQIGSGKAAAIGAAFSSIGVEAALGGSSVGRAMEAINLAINQGDAALGEFAGKLGINAQLLKETFQTDAVEGFILFLEALRDKGLGASAALDEIGLGGIFASKTLVPLANNLEVLTSTLETARREMENTTALDKEFEAVFGSFNNQWALFKNNVASSAREMSQSFMPELTSLLKTMNDTDAVSKIVDALGTLADVAMVGGTLYLGMKAMPVLIGAGMSVMREMTLIAYATRAELMMGADTLSIFNTQLFGTSVSAKLASGEITKLGLAVRGLFSFFIGFEIGSWLSDNFAEARVAGYAFVNAMMNGFERLKFGGEVVWETFSVGFDKASSFIKNKYADLLEFIGNGLEAIGADDMAASYKSFADGLRSGSSGAEDLKTRVAALRAEMERNIGVNDQILQDQIDWEAGGQAVVDVLSDVAGAQGEVNDKSDDGSSSANNLASALAEQTQKTEDVIAVLGEELALLYMTEEQKSLYNAITQAGTNITNEEAESIKRLVEQIEKRKTAIEEAKDADQKAQELKREAERERKEQQRAFEQGEKEKQRAIDKTRDKFAEFYADIRRSGQSTFDGLKQAFKSMIDYMVGQLVASGIMEFFSKGSGGFSLENVLSNSGVAGAITQGMLTKYAPSLAASLGLGATATGAAVGVQGIGTAGAVMTSAQWNAATAAGASSAGAATAAGAASGGLMSTIATAAPWIAGAIALYSVFNKKETPSMNAGLLLDPTLPMGKSGHSFQVDAFDSGLAPVGFYRRSDQGTATQAIDTFRSFDSAFTKTLKDAGIDFKISNEMIRALSVEGQGSGAFLGVAGQDGKPGQSIEQQITSFGRQLLELAKPQLTEEQYQSAAQYTDPTRMLQALQEALGVTEKIAEEQQKIADAIEEKRLREQADLQDELNQLTKDENELDKIKRDSLEETNRDLFDQVVAARKVKEIETERKGLQEELNELTMTSSQLLEQQRSKLNESNMALFDQIQVARKARDELDRLKEVEEQRNGLQSQLWQLTNNTNALRARELFALDATNRALQTRIYAIQDAETSFNKAMDNAGAAFSDLQDAVQRERDKITKTYKESSKQVEDSLNQIKGVISVLKSSKNQVLPSREQAAKQLTDFLSVAKSSGKLPDTEKLQSVMNVLNDNGEELYKTFEDYQYDFLRTANDIKELSTIANTQEDIAETQLKTLEDQYNGHMERLDNEIAIAQRQLDSLRGIEKNVLSLEEALGNFAQAINVARTAKGAYESVTKNQSSSYTNYGSDQIVDYIKKNNLGNNNGDLNKSVWEIYNASLSKNANPLDVGAALGFTRQETEAMLHKAGVPGYSLGSNLIENDQLAWIHRGEEIKPAQYVDLDARVREETNRILSSILLSTDGVRTQVEKCVDELEDVKEQSESIRNRLDMWEEIGQPAIRT